MKYSKKHEDILLELMFNLSSLFWVGKTEVMAITNEDWEILELRAIIWSGTHLSYELRRTIRNPLFLALFNNEQTRACFSINEAQAEVSFCIQSSYKNEKQFKELIKDFIKLSREWELFLKEKVGNQEKGVKVCQIKP
jgi:hypothetical protein